MRFDVITLFPNLFTPHLSEGVTRRAFESAQVEVNLWNLRDHADNAYRRVDDRPFGGGPGMVLLYEPLARALAAVRAARAEPAPLVSFSPTMPATTSAMLANRHAVAGSPKTRMPSAAPPTAPMPVHTT